MCDDTTVECFFWELRLPLLHQKFVLEPLPLGCPDACLCGSLKEKMPLAPLLPVASPENVRKLTAGSLGMQFKW